jgi:adenylylsulfate kinase
MPKMILIMGLPGSGKTTFAEKVTEEFASRDILFYWLNADHVRTEYDDWDFSPEGRIRAAKRMRELVDKSDYEYNVVDMVAPTCETRDILKPDIMVWMNTISKGRFDDTNEMFEAPKFRRDTIMLANYGDDYDARVVVNSAVSEDDF